jgi:hypothetical protein
MNMQMINNKAEKVLTHCTKKTHSTNHSSTAFSQLHQRGSQTSRTDPFCTSPTTTAPVDKDPDKVLAQGRENTNEMKQLNFFCKHSSLMTFE